MYGNEEVDRLAKRGNQEISDQNLTPPDSLKKNSPGQDIQQDACKENIDAYEESKCVVGNTGPVESKTKFEIIRYFEDTVTRDPEGRYKGALPWGLNDACLPSIRTFAEKRPVSTYRKLGDKKKGQKIIESLPIDDPSEGEILDPKNQNNYPDNG
ncbi:hypothetical protein NPIL_655621 [Nephila pilipes]|uniref:Uncharacterized protein n=1 Tax=Nephila pilipes TaxID=299642 RepID=A0A8X6I3E4_NEPPI|nr:hypothetical protein NPIL_655621 [Nephila pilipes]